MKISNQFMALILMIHFICIFETTEIVPKIGDENELKDLVEELDNNGGELDELMGSIDQKLCHDNDEPSKGIIKMKEPSIGLAKRLGRIASKKLDKYFCSKQAKASGFQKTIYDTICDENGKVLGIDEMGAKMNGNNKKMEEMLEKTIEIVKSKEELNKYDQKTECKKNGIIKIF